MIEYKKTFNPCDECNYSYSKNNEVSSMCSICEFNGYLVLDMEGRLVKLPCKPGDVVYVIENNTDVCWDCPHYECYSEYEDKCKKFDEWYVGQSEEPVCDKQHYYVAERRYNKEELLYRLGYFGKTHFVDEGEANKKVLELNKGKVFDVEEV